MALEFLDNLGATDDEVNAAIGTGDSLFSGVPSYMVAADSHNMGNNQGSLLDPTTWPDRAGNAAKFALSATARAVTSTWNIVPTVGNWFGADLEKADTESILRGFDDNLGDYYAANRTSVDIVGDVAASLVPGLAGVKVLNWGQKALALATEGKAGLNLAYSLGTLPSKSKVFADLAAKEISQSSQQFSWINGNVLKSLASGYGQAALEGAAFEITAATALSSSPLFEKHDISDVFYNAMLGGGLVGGTIMGSLTAASTYGSVKGAIKAIDKALNPARTTTELAAGAAASERLLGYIDDKHTVLTKPADIDDATWARTLQRRDNDLNNKIIEQSHSLVQKEDTALGNLFADNLRNLDVDTSYANLMGLRAIGRVGDDITPTIEADTLKALKKQVAADTGLNPFVQGKEYAAAVTEQVNKLKAERNPTKYLRVSGEDAGKVFEELPDSAFSFADNYRTAGEVEAAVGAKGYKQTDSWNPVAVSAQDAEARYIWARTQTLDSDSTIFVNDLPLLERAYELNLDSINIRHLDGTIENLPVNSGNFLNLLEDTKLSLADELLAKSVDVAGVTTAEIARKLNVSMKYLEGEINTADRASDLFALQSAAEKYTQRMIGNGLWKAEKGVIPTWLNPQHVQLSYDPKLLKDINGFELDALSYIKGRQKVYEQGMNNVVADYVGLYNPERLGQFVEISGADLLKADRIGSAPGLFTTANGAYGSLTSKVQAIGSATHQLINDVKDIVATRFTAHAQTIAQSPEAALELATIRQQILQTPEKYALRNGELVNVKQLQYEDAIAAGKKSVTQPVFEDAAAPVRIPVKNADMQSFLQDWISHNDSNYLTPQMNLRNQQGLQVKDMRGTLYFPGVDPKEFPYHAFVVDPSVTNTGQTRMIWARSQAELELLAKKVPSDFNVLYKGDTEAYFKARQSYDYNLGINQNYMDSALKKSGVAAPFFPQTDGVKLVQDLVQWRGDADSYLARDVVAGKYSTAFRTLERMDAQFTAAGTSKAQGKLATLREKPASPFRSYINTALDVREGGANPLWTGVNNLVETAFARLGANVEDLWRSNKTDDQIDAINAAFQKAGVSVVPYDAGLEALANHSAPKPILSQFVRKANSIMSTFMLRADPLNAVNNGIGANVLLGSETTALVRAIRNGSEEGAGELAALANVKIPGVEASEMLSPSKLIGQAYKNYFASVFGDSQNATKEFYKRNGWLSSISDQFKDSLDHLTLAGNESASEISSRLSKAGEIAKKLGDKAEKYTGNTFAEELNRFVAADVAKQISDLGVKHGVLTADQQLSYINTFINRTQGNFLASQRPALFQGPVGQAIGLFQTYQFNMLQQIFRHVSEGSKKDAAILLGLQGSIYGMNGLPAFNAINQYVVGQAAGNPNNRDIISTTYDVAGKEAGDWLLYGFSSNMFLHPDLKLNLYSRGDINPRQVTVVPTNLADVPVVGFATKFFGALKETAGKLSAGADVWPTLMQGIEHSGISRPLAGIAQVAEAFGSPNGMSYSTTNKGDMVMQNDLFSLANLTRLVGGKPLDEAIARDAVYRVQGYQSARTAEINKLGEAVKSTIIGGGVPTSEQINSFAKSYAEAGGKQENFSGWMHRLILNTNKSQANAISGNLKNPYSQYMQSIMGGYKLEDAAL